VTPDPSAWNGAHVAGGLQQTAGRHRPCLDSCSFSVVEIQKRAIGIPIPGVGMELKAVDLLKGQGISATAGGVVGFNPDRANWHGRSQLRMPACKAVVIGYSRSGSLIWSVIPHCRQK
jgi:hypothetical protein